MLLKHRPPGIDSSPVAVASGLEHLEQSARAVLRWLNANKVDYVVVGPVAHALRGDLNARGPVAVVPAPYGRNFDRLTSALTAEHAGLRSDRGGLAGSDREGVVAVKLTADKLARGRRWMFRFGSYDLDVEGAGNRGPEVLPGSAGTSAPHYQELLYEATRIELAEGLSVEVASPEDLEHFSHVRRTGTAPEFRVTRKPVADHGSEHLAGTQAAPDAGADAPAEIHPASESGGHAVADTPQASDPDADTRPAPDFGGHPVADTPHASDPEGPGTGPSSSGSSDT